jgi:hypothetical protein
MTPPAINVQRVALASMLLSTGLMVFLFAESRGDPSLRIAALVSGTGLVSSLIAIASMMLTGKDLSHPTDPSTLPPGSSVQSTQQETVHVPPVTTTSQSSVTTVPNATPPTP